MDKEVVKFLRSFDLVDAYRFRTESGRPVKSVITNCGYRGYLIDPKSAAVIEAMSKGRFTRKMLRPDDYWLVWPELAKNTSTDTESKHDV